MDPKKQNLTPEMKAIYERVMNTQVKSGTGPAPSVAPNSPPVVATTVSSPASPTSPAQVAPTPASPDLSSTQPHALNQNDGKPFVFSGGKVTGGHTDQKAAKVPGTGRKISPIIIVVGLIGFVVIYTVINLKLFGFF